MSNNEVFIIDDLAKFIESTRVLIFNSFGKTDDDDRSTIDEKSFLSSLLSADQLLELNQVLTQVECEVIAKDFVKEKVNKKTKKISYMISTSKYMQMIESFNSRMISNMLHNMVNKGLIETAYDSTANDFVFWIKQSGTN